MAFLSGLLRGGKSIAKQPTAAAGLQVQTSAYGKVIPIVYGTTRVAPNLIWYGGFTATQQSSSVGGKGGLTGSGGKGGGSGSYVYSASFELALCEGTIAAIRNVYADKNITTTEQLGMAVFSGAYQQVPWSYLLETQGEVTDELHTVPSSGALTVSTNQPFLYDLGVSITTEEPFSYQPNDQLLPAGSYKYIVNYSNVVYDFNASDNGKIVVITYTLGSQPKTFTGTIASSKVTVTGILGSEYKNKSVVTTTGVSITKVSGTPAANQYAESAGAYTFNAAQAGVKVFLNYVPNNGSSQALGYSGIAYTAAGNFSLGNNPSLPNFNFEVQGSTATIGLDADPSVVVSDYLTNVHYGVGFPSSRVGNLSTYQAYCLATGLVISPCYDTQTEASSTLDDLATATNSAFVWSSGTLTLVPYGDLAVTGNGYTYTPPSAPLYSLTDDDFLPNTNATASSATVNDDPVLLTRKRPADAYNSIKVECLDRSNNYSPSIIEAQDQAAIITFGLRQDSTRTQHMFATLNPARISVQLQLQRQAIRNVYQFTLDQRYVLLDPMDIVAISDANLGLVNQWVRITEITENDDSSLSIVAEEYLDGTGSAPLFTYQEGQGFNADYNADPGDTNYPVMFEPTAELAEDLEVWVAASGGDMWGGCEVWISQDNETFQNVGKITGPSRQGFVDGALPAVTQAASGLTIDTANTLLADISLSGGQMLSASQADAQNLATLCYLGTGNNYELLSYQNATLLNDSYYSLNYLVRGAYDSPILNHAAGEQFARIDSSLFKYAYTQDRIWTNLYIKLLSFNIYGGGQQNLDDVSAYTFTLQGLAYSSPLPDVQNFRTSYVANITQLAWDNVTDFRAVLYEIRRGSSWTGAQVLGRVAHPPFNVQGNGTYWISAYSQPLPGLQVYSEAPEEIIIAGAQIVSNVIATWNEGATGWTGAVGGSAGLSGSAIVLTGAGNILSDPNYLNDANIFDFGGIGGTGTYTIPNSHIVNIGRIAPCSVIISSQSLGQHVGDNVLSIADYLDFQDLLDFSAQGLVNIYPNIALSQDGTTWGPWQKWTPGSYSAMAFKAQAVLETMDPTVQAILESFVFEVDVPDRDDHYTNLSVGSAGITLNFTPDGSSTPAPFNGGPANGTLPAVQITLLNAQAGDTPVLGALTLSSCTLRVVNGGTGVVRSMNVLAEGF